MPPRAAGDLHEALARRLHDAMTSVTPVPPLVAEHPDLDVDDAYRIQQGLVRRILDADGGRAVGYKLGLTSAPMQQMLGVDQPDYAPVLSTMVFGDGHDIDLSRYIAPKVEAEPGFSQRTHEVET